MANQEKTPKNNVIVKKPNLDKSPLITLIDFLGGASAGITQVLVGQPFDIVKTRLQVSGGSAIQICKDIVKDGGPKAFYKGTLSPLIGMSFCIALQFTGFNFAKRLIARSKYDSDVSRLNTIDLMIAGFISGLWYTWIMSPMELFRIKMQVKTGPKYASSIDAGVRIFKEQGIRGAYFGYLATTIRETFGSMIYFGVYETCMGLQLPKYNNNRKEVPIWKVMIFGGLSGYLLWTIVFPADIIKSRQQGSDFTNSPYRSFLKTGAQILNERGLMGMYSGIIPCQIRAIAANAASFVAYEFTMDKLRKKQNKI